ncbi:hypothetical protein NPS70_15690 [Streptomyces sp. C10-9-1]|uniref:hypothetical protein n=1 Tax=Streptomyces sp. C10-9-1 TaxID=1859285 RepID=UPI0021126C6C|nr:hypothetical protein [Streptomyces sp. C10-9-1]MCQ6554630.1 hypothetical protein [Streptomyces sp. C10-9-1]
MNAGPKAAAFAVLLTAVFGAAWGAGAAFDPVVAGAEPARHADHQQGRPEAESGGGAGAVHEDH